MIIIGCDFHPSWQQIAWVDTETGETGEQKLVHADGEAERYYRQLSGPVRIGLESTGNWHWVVDILTEMGHEVWIGGGAKIRALEVRKQEKAPRRAAHIPEVLMANDVPRIWSTCRRY